MNRNQAIEKGLKHYHGKPCNTCRETLKYVSGYSCVACTTKKTKERDPEIYKKYTQSEKGRTRRKEYRKTETYRDIQNRWKSKDYHKHKDKYHGYNVKRYGLSVEQYNKMYVEQDGKCYICKETDSRKLAVDHNHQTGENRKLLCIRCNTALGLLREDTTIMKSLISYVEKH